MSDPYSQWNDGVLSGISAPNNDITRNALWAWSGKESLPYSRMHINNPLNCTVFMGALCDGGNWNDIPVRIYKTVQCGINATVETLLNGDYPTIVANLRNSVPYYRWQNACAELDLWGSHCNWLGTIYGDAPGNIGGSLDATESAQLQGIYDSTGNGQGDTIFGVLKDQIVATIGNGQGKQIMPELATITAQLDKIIQLLTPATPQPQASSSPVGQDVIP